MAKQVIIDVRESDEYQAEHIPGSVHIPLGDLQTDTARVLGAIPAEASLLIMCRSGKRASIACDHLKGLGIAGRREISVYEGGILEWKRKGLATNITKARHFPIMRQVQIVAGLLVVTSIALGHFLSPTYLLIGAAVGTGLTVAGATGFCGMAILLGKAPWNRVAVNSGES